MKGSLLVTATAIGLSAPAHATTDTPINLAPDADWVSEYEEGVRLANNGVQIGNASVAGLVAGVTLFFVGFPQTCVLPASPGAY